METGNTKSLMYIGTDKMNKFVVKQALGKGYSLIHIESYIEAMSKISALIGRVSAILCCSDDLTIEMQMFAEDCVNKDYVSSVPLIALMPDKVCEERARDAYKSGFTEVLAMPFDPFYLKTKIDALCRIYSKSSGGTKDNDLADQRTNVIINILADVFTFIQFEPADHIKRSKELTQILTIQFADMFPEYGLNDDDIDYITKASALHDIGKAAIPTNILFKAGKLTNEEFDIMKEHTIKGEQLLMNFGLDRSHKFFNYAFDICKYHHERWDGNGYPDHLKGEQIPVAAQIYSLIDVYNALIAERVYKAAIPYEKALTMIREGQCGVFPPKVIEAFNACEEKSRNYLEKSLRIRIAPPEK